MSSSEKKNVNVVFGAMTFGPAGREGARITTVEEAAGILDVFQKHGYREVDTARMYINGGSEAYLADAQWESRGLTMETKLYPTAGRGMEYMTSEMYTHSPEDLRKGLFNSLAALKTKKINMWYLHGPDRNTPFEATLGEVNKLYKEGYFERFGISNFQSWEVAEICEICNKNGWIKPTVYQGIYNAIHRAVEPELFPCLRFYGISFYAFQPLAGSFLTGKFKRDTKDFEEGCRFDPNRRQGKLHHTRYWNDESFRALDLVSTAAGKHGLTVAECALRWMSHHSQLSKGKNDAVIIGASSAKQLESNLTDLEKGPLPEDVVKAFDDGWQFVRARVFKYWH